MGDTTDQGTVSSLLHSRWRPKSTEACEDIVSGVQLRDV